MKLNLIDLIRNGVLIVSLQVIVFSINRRPRLCCHLRTRSGFFRNITHTCSCSVSENKIEISCVFICSWRLVFTPLSWRQHRSSFRSMPGNLLVEQSRTEMWGLEMLAARGGISSINKHPSDQILETTSAWLNRRVAVSAGDEEDLALQGFISDSKGRSKRRRPENFRLGDWIFYTRIGLPENTWLPSHCLGDHRAKVITSRVTNLCVSNRYWFCIRFWFVSVR